MAKETEQVWLRQETQQAVTLSVWLFFTGDEGLPLADEYLTFTLPNEEPQRLSLVDGRQRFQAARTRDAAKLYEPTSSQIGWLCTALRSFVHQWGFRVLRIESTLLLEPLRQAGKQRPLSSLGKTGLSGRYLVSR